MGIRLIFSDIDGTLIGEDQVIHEKNIAMIAKAQEMGIHFVLCSGRLPCALMYLVDGIGLKRCENEYVVAGNGSLIIDTLQNVVIENNISNKNVKIVLDYLIELGISVVQAARADHYYCLKTNHPEEILKYPSASLCNREEFDELIKTKTIDKILVQDERAGLLSVARKAIPTLTNGEIHCDRSSSNNLEIINHDVSKAEAVHSLCKIVGCTTDECLALGDHFNDLEMINACGHAACPDNAISEIKERCDYISKYTAKDGAVGDILAYYLNNN